MVSFFIRLIDSIVWPMLLVVSIWIVFFLNVRYQLNLNVYGVHPLSWEHWYGIFTMIFLHSDIDHLFGNSIPLLLSMGFIFINFNSSKAKIIVLNVISTGALLFLIGEPGSNHIGASGIVYAFIFFIVTHSFLSKNKEMLAASFTLIFLYGSLIYGLFPEFGKIIGKNISWEGHLSGAISGIVIGFLFRNKGPQQIALEDESDDFDDEDYWKLPEDESDNKQNDETKYNYVYKQK